MDWNTRACVVLIFGTTVACLQAPEQIHISYGSNHDSMVVMWSSGDMTDWEVHYGTTPTLFNMSANSTMTKLPDSNFKAVKHIYRSELNNLTRATTYFYKVVSSDRQVPTTESQCFKFKTLPTQDSYNVDTVERTMRYVVYGDMGARDSNPTRAAIEELRKTKEVHAILHIGDFAYDLNSDGGKVGDMFMNEIQSLAAEIPYMTSPGNHEISEEFQPYRIRFSSPNTPWPIPLDRMWYSFNVGLVHFISYSTEVYFTNMEEYVCKQFHWLMKDLITANQNRDKRPWIIAVGHRPMYCSNTDGDDCTDSFMRRWVRSGLEPLFNAQGVDLVIQAHEHSYERLYPIFNGKVERFNYTNARAPVHIISGAAGSKEGSDEMTDSPHDWSAYRSTGSTLHSFGILEIHNRSHVYFSQHSAMHNSTVDQIWIVQDRHGPFVEDFDCLSSFADESCFCHLPLIHFRTVIIIFSATMVIMIMVCGSLVAILLKRRVTRLKSNRDIISERNIRANYASRDVVSYSVVACDESMVNNDTAMLLCTPHDS